MAKKPVSAVVPIARVSAADRKLWRAQDALLTLTRADKIRKDSKLMRDVQAEAKRQAEQAQATLAKVERAQATLAKVERAQVAPTKVECK